MTTIRVHEQCNNSYKEDEEYFVETIVPFAQGSEAGDAIFNKFVKNIGESERKRTLANSVLREFELRPSGLHLPSTTALSYRKIPLG